MKSRSESIVELGELLQSIPPGPVSCGIDGPLANAWDDLENRGICGGMTAIKIFGRLEKLEWKPPVLSFQIERHGATVFGSTRAEMQHWEVNVEAGTREIVYLGHRQLYPMAKRWNCVPVARELASCVRKGLDHQGLRWRKDGKVTINRDFIPSCAKQTMEDRAKRLNDTIGGFLGDRAWRDKPWRPGISGNVAR